MYLCIRGGWDHLRVEAGMLAVELSELSELISQVVGLIARPGRGRSFDCLRDSFQKRFISTRQRTTSAPVRGNEWARGCCSPRPHLRQLFDLLVQIGDFDVRARAC